MDRRFGACFSLDRDGLLVHARSPSIESVSCLSRCARMPACESLRSGPHAGATPRSFRDDVREDFTAARSDTTSIEKHISTTDVLRRLPRTGWHMVPTRTSSLGSVGLSPPGLALRPFTATIPCCFGKHGCLG